MTTLSKPSAEKTRALRAAVASYMDHIGLHDNAEFMRAQPDDFTAWSAWAHQLVTVMDKKTFQKDLPPNIEGMMAYSKEKTAELTARNRREAESRHIFADSRKSWGQRPQSENVIDRRDKGRLPVEPSLLAQALAGAQELGERGQRGFGKIIAALMGESENATPQPRSREEAVRSLRDYSSEIFGGLPASTIDKHAWDAAGGPLAKSGDWFDRGEQLMRDAWLEANRKDQSTVGGDTGGSDPAHFPGGYPPFSDNPDDFDGDGQSDLPDLLKGGATFAAGGRQARPGMTVNSNTGAEFVNPSPHADPGLRAPANTSFQRSMYGPLDIKGWSPAKAPTPASDVASTAASKSAAKALAAALAGDTAQMGNPDQTMSDISTFGEFAGIPTAGSWSGEDGGDPEKEAMRDAAVSDIDPNDAVMVDLVAPPTAPPAPNYGLDEAFRDAYAAVFGASESPPEALDVDITEGNLGLDGLAAAGSITNRGLQADKISMMAGDMFGTPPSQALGAPTSPMASPALNSFGVFGSEANFGTPSGALADVDPMTAFTRDISAPPAAPAMSLSPSQMTTAYNGFGQFGDEAKYGMSDIDASIATDPMTAFTRSMDVAPATMAGDPMGESMGLGDFAGIGSPTADQAVQGEKGLSAATSALGKTSAVTNIAKALGPLDAFHDAFEGSVKSVGPKAKAAFRDAYADPESVAKSLAAIEATRAYTNMNGLRNNPEVLGLRSQQIANFGMANPSIGNALGLSMGQGGQSSVGGGLGGDPFGGGGFGGIGGPSGGSGGGSGGGFGGPGGQPSGPSFSGPSGPSAGAGGGYGGGTSGGQPSGPSFSGPSGPAAGSGGSYGGGNPAGSPSPGGVTTGRGPGSNPGAGGGLSSSTAAAIAGALAGEADRAEADAAAAASSDAARGFGGYGGFGGLGGGWF